MQNAIIIMVAAVWENTNNTFCLLLKCKLNIYSENDKNVVTKSVLFFATTAKDTTTSSDCIKISIVYLLAKSLKLGARKQA